MEGKTGLGDFGKTAVTWTDDEDAAVKKSIKEFGFNLVTSDKVALDRIPADLRDSKCKYVDYPKKLPRVSVIIVFHKHFITMRSKLIYKNLNMSLKSPGFLFWHNKLL